MKKSIIIVATIGACATAIAVSLNSWSLYDSVIETIYSTTGADCVHLPPGEMKYDLHISPIFFSSESFPEITSASGSDTVLGVPAWRVYVYETNETARVFASEVNNARVHTKEVRSYDSQEWSMAVYGAPPRWLTNTELEKWYAERSRDRMRFCLTFIPEEYEAIYSANLALVTDNPGTFLGLPSKPSNTNTIAFAQVGIVQSQKGIGFQMYAPKAMTINLFGKNKLSDENWKFLGSIESSYTFTPASVGTKEDSYFIRAERGDVDTDGDGISDGMELYCFRTNPNKWDSGNSGVSDGDKIYRLGMDPNFRDSDEDGYDDEEEIRAGTDPTIAENGASGTIRYYYDDDDRLTATYIGKNGGGTVYELTPAGNFRSTHQREAK